jgi:uncharacterized protein YqhQ
MVSKETKRWHGPRCCTLFLLLSYIQSSVVFFIVGADFTCRGFSVGVVERGIAVKLEFKISLNILNYWFTESSRLRFLASRNRT